MKNFEKDRDTELEKLKDKYFNGEIGSDYYGGSKYMADWAYLWFTKRIEESGHNIGEYINQLTKENKKIRDICDDLAESIERQNYLNLEEEAEALAECLCRYENISAPMPQGDCHHSLYSYSLVYANSALERWNKFRGKK